MKHLAQGQSSYSSVLLPGLIWEWERGRESSSRGKKVREGEKWGKARNLVEQEGELQKGCKMDEELIANFVSAYLKKKGFRETEQAFQEELRHNKTNCSSPSSLVDIDVAKHLLSFSEYFLYSFSSYWFPIFICIQLFLGDLNFWISWTCREIKEFNFFCKLKIQQVGLL